MKYKDILAEYRPMSHNSHSYTQILSHPRPGIDVGFYLLIKDKKPNSSLLLNSIPFLLSCWKYLGLY